MDNTVDDNVVGITFVHFNTHFNFHFNFLLYNILNTQRTPKRK